MINCVPDYFKSYGLTASITIMTLEEIKRNTVKYPEKVGERLQKAADFLSVAILPDEELRIKTYISDNEFSVCVTSLSRAKLIEEFAPAEEGLKKARQILTDHLAGLNEIRLQLANEQIESIAQEKLDTLQDFFQQLLESENTREANFRYNHPGPFTNLIVAAGKLA